MSKHTGETHTHRNMHIKINIEIMQCYEAWAHTFIKLHITKWKTKSEYQQQIIKTEININSSSGIWRRIDRIINTWSTGKFRTNQIRRLLFRQINTDNFEFVCRKAFRNWQVIHWNRSEIDELSGKTNTQQPKPKIFTYTEREREKEWGWKCDIDWDWITWHCALPPQHSIP